MKNPKRVVIKTILTCFIIGSLLISCKSSIETPVNENDLAVVLHTLTVLDQNYYASDRFVTDDHFIIEPDPDTNPIAQFLGDYKIKEIINPTAFITQWKTIYHKIFDGDNFKIELKDWEVKDFVLSTTFPTFANSLFFYFSTRDVEINGDLNWTAGNFGPTISSTSNDGLKITTDNTTYDIVFSYYVDMSGPVTLATASLTIDDMDYSSELKAFLENVYKADN